MKVRLMINGWRSPVNQAEPLGKPKERIFVGKQLCATIEGQPEDIEALREGLRKGHKPEAWIMEEIVMNEAFGYRIGAVQAMTGFTESMNLGFCRRNDVRNCIIHGKEFHPFNDLSMFSLKIVKKALKQIKKDYPYQKVRFGKYPHKEREFLAIQPEHPTPPDQWMIVAPVVEVDE